MSGTNYSLQDKFLKRFFNSRFGPDFYLTGGTALARFYFQHRDSVDLDLFTHNQKIDFAALMATVLSIAKFLNWKVRQQVTTDTFLQFILETPDKSELKVDFVKDINVRFGKIETRDEVRIDSLENIASNKVLAVFGRTEPKDFVDLYFILESGKFEFEKLYKDAKKKDLGLTEFYLANSMGQIVDVEKRLEIYKNFDWNKMVEFYQDLSRKLLLKIKPRK